MPYRSLPPKRVFKYVGAARFENLLADQLIRFTQPGLFNDPFEMPAFRLAEARQALSPILELSKVSLAATGQASEILQQTTTKPANIPSAALRPAINPWMLWAAPWLGTPKEEPPMSPEEAREVLAKLCDIDNTFGILSLTGKYDNLLMWAHYADEHKGVVIEIDIEKPAFAQEGKDFQKANWVKYGSERPKLPISQDVLMEHFFTKSPQWEYEQEFRIVRLLEKRKEALVSEGCEEHPICLLNSAIPMAHRFSAS